jgi:Na+/proline symporter
MCWNATLRVYQLTGESPQATSPKGISISVFHRTHIPPGIAGLFAALFGAAMATLSSDLNRLALVLRTSTTSRPRARINRDRLVAFPLHHAAPLPLYRQLSAHSRETALSPGIRCQPSRAAPAGIFCWVLSDRANRYGCYTGIVASLAFTLGGLTLIK